MKYISLTIVALYLGIIASFAQSLKKDTIPYEKRKLKFEQADLVNSYYNQDGNNSAVTGGIGTEKLTDISNTFDLKLSKYGKTGLKHTYNFEVGFDSYTSASSDNIGFILNYLKNNPGKSVEIIGYADEIGNSAYNNKLSADRAENVKIILTKAGISPSRLTIKGNGIDNSVDKNSDYAKRLVRKVVFKITN